MPLLDEVEVAEQFCVGGSVVYKAESMAESKVSKATITAITEHIDSKAYHIELANGVDLLANSENLFSFNPTTIPLQIGGDLVKRRQCRAIMSIGVIRLVFRQPKFATVRMRN